VVETQAGSRFTVLNCTGTARWKWAITVLLQSHIIWLVNTTMSPWWNVTNSRKKWTWNLFCHLYLPKCASLFPVISCNGQHDGVIDNWSWVCHAFCYNAFTTV